MFVTTDMKKESTDRALFSAARSHLQLSRSCFADLVKVSPHTIRSIERGTWGASERLRNIVIEIFAPLPKKETGHLSKDDFCYDIRTGLQMSQREFAYSLQVSPSIIKSVETYRRKLRPELKRKILELQRSILPTKRACGYILDGAEYQVHLSSCDQCRNARI